MLRVIPDGKDMDLVPVPHERGPGLMQILVHRKNGRRLDPIIGKIGHDIRRLPINILPINSLRNGTVQLSQTGFRKSAAGQQPKSFMLRNSSPRKQYICIA